MSLRSTIPWRASPRWHALTDFAIREGVCRVKHTYINGEEVGGQDLKFVMNRRSDGVTESETAWRMLLVTRVDDIPYLVTDVVVPSHVEGCIPRISVLALGTRHRCASTWDWDGTCGDRSWCSVPSSKLERKLGEWFLFPLTSFYIFYSTFCAWRSGDWSPGFILFSVETESDSGSVDSDQIPLFQGFGIDSNLFFKIRIWDSLMIRMVM